jgi:hypothetical protein
MTSELNNPTRMELSKASHLFDEVYVRVTRVHAHEKPTVNTIWTIAQQNLQSPVGIYFFVTKAHQRYYKKHNLYARMVVK